ncbi:MAG: hypothetical protein KAI18_03900, partial [Candidatus Aenigmarchaeota archaeon]|nr:hypothetical protein [Candidatus Aenigmarchaeota archaeon]
TDSNSEGNMTTTFHDYTLTTDDIMLGQSHVGNASYVNRSLTIDPVSVRLAHSVNDTVRNVLIGATTATLYINVTNDNAANYTTVDSNTTNSTGYINFDFLPDCSYSVGAQKWQTYTESDTCYSDKLSSYFTVYVQGDLRPNVTLPKDLEQYQNGIENVTINITLFDECGLDISNAELNITLNNTDVDAVDYCTDVINLGSGNYSCEWETTVTGVGRYDVIVKAYNVTYYNNGTTTLSDSFRVIPPINNAPNLTNNTMVYDIDGWGATFNFSVEVYDKDYDTVNVSFWISSDNSTWVFEDSQNCTACNDWNQLNFSYEGFSCSDQQEWYFKFNATDYENDTELSGVNFTVEKDDVTVVYSVGGGNATYVNRTSPGTTQLIFSVFDADNVSNPALPSGRNGTFWVSYDDTTYDDGYFNQTNSTGHINYIFKPSCSPKYAIGPQNWTGGIKDDTCYFDTNDTESLIVYVVGEMNDTLVSPLGGDFFENDNVSIRVNLTQECDATDLVVDAAVDFSVHHDAYSATCSVVNEADGNYNCTWNVTGAPGGWYNITINSTRQYLNPISELKVNSFFHQINPVITGAVSDRSSIVWGNDAAKSQVTFTVNVT